MRGSKTSDTSISGPLYRSYPGRGQALGRKLLLPIFSPAALH